MISVSNIERFAIHDGPGIRTTVFLKGCPLHCPWCANPETWTVEPVVMHKENTCVGCRTCQHVCPKQAVSFASGRFSLNRASCDACGICVRECLPGALSINGEQMDEDAVIAEVLKDRAYYEESGGGVTFSGGEPLFQKEAVLKLLKKAKEAGLHVAAETTGVYSNEFLKQAEPYIDLFLFDIKHVNGEKLEAVTGAPWDVVRENFEYLCQRRGQDMIVRIPVIPGFNREDLEDILAFVRQYPIRAVNLLPYHALGETKWHQLERAYRYNGLPGMKKEDLLGYQDDLVSIGG